MRLAMDDCRHFEPQQVAFVVVVGAALPIEPASAESKSEAAFCIGRIAQRPPRTPRPSRPKLRRNASQVFAILFRRKQSAPSSQQWTEEIRKSLVAPQQVGLHWLLIVGNREIRRPPIFSVARMHELV